MLVLLLIVMSGLLLLCAWLIRSCLRVVRVRQVLVIYNRVTGKVGRIIVGPRTAMVLPMENIQSLDLTTQTVHLSASDVVTSDLAIATSLDVFYAFDPALLRVDNLDRLLPFLTKVEKIVQSWANYILRSLAAGYTTAELLTVPVHRARLENLLRQTLQDRVHVFGLHIYTIRLLCYPAPTMLEAKLTAARVHLAAQVRAQALEMLATALGPEHDITHILPFELLQRLQGPSDIITALNLSLPVAAQADSQDPLAMHWVLASH